MKYKNINEARRGLDDLIKGLMSRHPKPAVNMVNHVINEWVKAHFAIDEKGRPLNDEAKTMLLQIRGAIYPKNIDHGLGLLEFTKSSADFLRELAKGEQAGTEVFYNAFNYKPDRSDLSRERVLQSRQLGQQAEKISFKRLNERVVKPIAVDNHVWQKNSDQISKDFNHQPFSEQLERYVNLVAKQDGATPDRIIKAIGSYLQEFAKIHYAYYHENDDEHPINVAFNTYTLETFNERFDAFNLPEAALEAFYNHDFNEHLQKGRIEGSSLAMINAAEKALQSSAHLDHGRGLLTELNYQKAKRNIKNIPPPEAAQTKAPIMAQVFSATPSAFIVLPTSEKDVRKQVTLLLNNVNEVLALQQKEHSSKNKLVHQFKKNLQRKNANNHNILMGYYLKSIKSHIAAFEVFKSQIKTPAEFITVIGPLKQLLQAIQNADLKAINLNEKHQKGIKDLTQQLSVALAVRSNKVLEIAKDDARNALNALLDSKSVLNKLQESNASQGEIDSQTAMLDNLQATVDKLKNTYYSIEKNLQQVTSTPKSNQEKNVTDKMSPLQRAKQLLRNPPILSSLCKSITEQPVSRETSKRQNEPSSKRNSRNDPKKKP